mmetsp:Transcript_64384/g.74129  ORF Transcript_64384/g.74129 Transcript_64384/m.74129 type:complete len:153 (-) Transcript_64384:403-861(-)
MNRRLGYNRIKIDILSIKKTEVFNKQIEKERGNCQRLPSGEQGSLLEIVDSSCTRCDSSTFCQWSKESDSSCILFSIEETIILGSNGSIPWDDRAEWAVGDQEGLHLVTHGDGLTSNCIVRFNIFLVNQTYRIQPEFLVGDATGLEFGNYNV